MYNTITNNSNDNTSNTNTSTDTNTNISNNNNTVGFHNFNLRILNLRVSNPNK